MPEAPAYIVVTFTVPTAADGLSDAKDLGGYTPVAIDMPADWTAGNITFQAKALDSETVFDNVYDSGGTELSVTAAEDRYIVLDSVARQALTGVIKLRSGTSGTPVQQGASRTVRVVCRKD